MSHASYCKWPIALISHVICHVIIFLQIGGGFDAGITVPCILILKKQFAIRQFPKNNVHTCITK